MMLGCYQGNIKYTRKYDSTNMVHKPKVIHIKGRKYNNIKEYINPYPRLFQKNVMCTKLDLYFFIIER